MSTVSCSPDRRPDRLQDALALPVTWPRGRKVPYVGDPISLKPSHWRGERTRRGPIPGSSSRHVGTHQIRWEGVESRRTVGRPNPTGETAGTHQRDRDRSFISFDARGIPVSVKRRVRRNKDTEKRVNRRRQRTVRRRAQKEKREREEARRAKRAEKEVVVATWNVRTLAVKGKNGLGHAETLLLRAQKSQCDIIGLQEVRRGGQGSFVAAGYTVYFSGSDKGGNHGVGLAVAKRIVEASGTCTPEPINERLLKVQLSLSGKSNKVTFVVAYAPTECAADNEKTRFWSMLLETVASVPRKDHLFVLMDANARTGKRDGSGSLEYTQVIGPYGRDVLNDNGEHLVRTAADAGMAITNTFFSTPKGGQQSTYVSPKGDAWRLDYILARHADRRLIRKVTVFPVSRAESDHSIVAATIRLRGRFAPNRPKRPANRQPRIDRQMLVNNSDVRRDLARAIENELRESPVSPTGEVDCMVSMFTEKVLRTATRLLPPPHGEHRHTDGVRMRTCVGSWMKHGKGGRKHGRCGGR